MAKTTTPVPESKKLIALKIGGGCCSAMCIAFVLFAVGCEMLIKQRPTYTVALSDVTWKTFTSEQPGFTFQFPADYRVRNPSIDDTDTANAAVEYVSTRGNTWYFDVASKDEMSIIKIIWRNFGDYETVSEIAAKRTNHEPVTIDGVAGISYTGNESGDLYSIDYVGYAFSVDGETLDIHFNGDMKMNDVEQAIIDSLTFTK